MTTTFAQKAHRIPSTSRDESNEIDYVGMKSLRNDFDIFGHLKANGETNESTYVNAVRSKCVFGGKPGSKTTRKKTMSKLRIARKKHLQHPMMT